MRTIKDSILGGYHMMKSFKIALAYIGVIVGAGFASGQEILQYFTSYGIIGTAGTMVSIILFAISGKLLVQTGCIMKANSHKEVIYKIGGNCLGKMLDIIMTFTLFCVGVVMIAGAGANLKQQFGFPIIVGSTLMALLIVIVSMMNTDRVISTIGYITPFLIMFIVITCLYSINTIDQTFNQLQEVALIQPKNFSNWFISAMNYVSFNTALGAPMALVIGGAQKYEKMASAGGLLGGMIVGILIFLSHLAMFGKIIYIAGYDMPLLELVSSISTKLGFVMAIILFGMICNTAIGMFYAFSARFAKQGSRKFKKILCVFVLIAYLLSFVGFTDLVSILYPLIGYLGFVFIFVLVRWWFRERYGKNVIKSRINDC